MNGTLNLSHSFHKDTYTRPPFSHCMSQHISLFHFCFATFFTPSENNFYAYSFITDGDSFTGTPVFFSVKVASRNHQSTSAYSGAPKSAAVRLVRCSQSALLSLSPLIPAQWAFCHNKICQHTADMQMPNVI